MDNTTNIRDRIQYMVKQKFSAKKSSHLLNNVNKRSSNLRSSVVSNNAAKNRRSELNNLENQDQNIRYSTIDQKKRRLIEKANATLKDHNFKYINKSLMHCAESINSEKNMIQSIIQKFQDSHDDSLLASQVNQLKSRRPSQKNIEKQPLNFFKFPNIDRKSNITGIQKSIGLPELGNTAFNFNRSERNSVFQDMSSFIECVDKQKSKHSIVKSRLRNQILKIQNLKNLSEQHKLQQQFGEIRDCQYRFHDVFFRCRKAKNHINIQQI